MEYHLQIEIGLSSAISRRFRWQGPFYHYRAERLVAHVRELAVHIEIVVVDMRIVAVQSRLSPSM